MAQESPDARPQGAKVLSLRSTLEWAPYDAKRASPYASEPASPGTRRSARRGNPAEAGAVHPELGREHDYLGSPCVVARELVGSADYYLSHASAMDLHQMVTQPQLVVYTTTQAIRPRVVLDTEFRFVRCKPEHLFGSTHHWITKTEKIQVSDLERTIIDGLKQSEYCGGFTEVAKGFWMRRDDLDYGKLVDYAKRLDVGAVTRRLGFLLETFEVDAPRELERLQKTLTATYAILDPLLPEEGKFMARWRLRLNVDPDEIVSVVRT